MALAVFGEGRQSTGEEIAVMQSSNLKYCCGKLSVQTNTAPWRGAEGASWGKECGIWCYPTPCKGQGYISSWSPAATLVFSHIERCIATHLLGHLLSCLRTRIRTATLFLRAAFQILHPPIWKLSPPAWSITSPTLTSWDWLLWQ